MLLNKIREHKGSVYVALGATIIGAPVVLSACQEVRAQQGVISTVREVQPGRFVIENEQMTEGPAKLIIHYMNGQTKEVTDPDEFAQYLPKTPPPQNYGGTYHSGGYGLGDVLLFSMLMNAWRPAYYPSSYMYSPPPRAYRSTSVYNRVQKEVRPAYLGMARRGLAPTSAQSYKQTYRANGTRVAPSSRATRPSSGRSGFFRGSGGRSFGG